jgi:hypothetical protein
MVMQTGVQKAERTAINPNYYTGATLAVKQPGKFLLAYGCRPRMRCASAMVFTPRTEAASLFGNFDS